MFFYTCDIPFRCGISQDRLHVAAITILNLSDLKQGRCSAHFLYLSKLGWQEGYAHHDHTGTVADKGFVSACAFSVAGTGEGDGCFGHWLLKLLPRCDTFCICPHFIDQSKPHSHVSKTVGKCISTMCLGVDLELF